MKSERLAVVHRPGWDCLTGNHCEHAGHPGKNHGIHGDEYIFGIASELPSGRRVALTLLIFTNRFPSTVDEWRTRDHRGPYGASLDLHLQIPANSEPPTPYGSVAEFCQWLGAGRRCYADGSCLLATELYAAHGNLSPDTSVDLTVQSDEFWQAMENQMLEWARSRS